MAHTSHGDTELGDQLIATVKAEGGTTLIETTIATAILLVMLAGLLSMASLAAMYTENHGHLSARATEYAQDKMEQLLGLAYTDAVSDTTTFPTGSSGGTGLAVGGGTSTAAPVNLYVDWLASDGTLLGGGTAQPVNWYFERVWQISAFTPNVKQITVTATTRTSFGKAIIPKATVVALKSSQF